MKEKVTAKIRELVPELQELSFGCEVEVLRDKEEPWFTIKNWNLVAVDDRKLILRPMLQSVDEDLQSVDIKHCKVIGQPIHMEHMMLAIEKRVKNSQDYGTKVNGEFYEIYQDKLLFSYDLTKPFDEQSPELFKYLEILL